VLYILAAAFAAIAGFAAVMLGDHFAQIPAPAERAAETGRAAGTANTGGDLGAASIEDGKGGMSKLVWAEPPREHGEVTFADENGQTRSLADWKGKVVLLNLWATWCAPCKQEMPGINRLQAELGGGDFAVVPVSLDRQGPNLPRKFLADNKIDKLSLLIDTSAQLAGKVGAIGLPASLILDREGREVARLLGPAEWDSPAALEVIRGVIAGKKGP
jgi:thiol-disulfide isomerase/thioredoxin